MDIEDGQDSIQNKHIKISPFQLKAQTMYVNQKLTLQNYKILNADLNSFQFSIWQLCQTKRHLSLYPYRIQIQDNKKANQMVMIIVSTQSVSLLMEIHQHLVVMISLSVFGISKHDHYTVTTNISSQTPIYLSLRSSCPYGRVYQFLRLRIKIIIKIKRKLLFKKDYCKNNR